MKNNVFKKVTSMAVASAMVATMGVSAFAADSSPKVSFTASANLVKYVEIADGVNVPENDEGTFLQDFTLPLRASLKMVIPLKPLRPLITH